MLTKNGLKLRLQKQYMEDDLVLLTHVFESMIIHTYVCPHTYVHTLRGRGGQRETDRIHIKKLTIITSKWRDHGRFLFPL